jgi:hypothetical protein
MEHDTFDYQSENRSTIIKLEPSPFSSNVNFSEIMI